jgi:hypothetical protein
LFVFLLLLLLLLLQGLKEKLPVKSAFKAGCALYM